MPTYTPVTPVDPDPGVEAGVIKDARRRERRHRLVAAALALALLIAVGLIFGISGGGGGSGGVERGRGYGSSASSGAHAASQVGAASIYAPPTVGPSGLLAPGVGWAVNGIGFYMTWDSGVRWADVKIPGLSGDVVANFEAAATPNPRTLIVAIGDGGTQFGTCADPDPGSGTNRSIGAIAVSTDAGHHWHTSPFPGCANPTHISFPNAQSGFAVSVAIRARRPELLYRTKDSARTWQFVGRLPGPNASPDAIDFTSARVGWLLARNRIYRTTDGGETWRRAHVCTQPADRTVTLVCGPPSFSGSDGTVQVIRAVAGVAVSTSVETTTNDGSTWTTHQINVSRAVQGKLAAQMSTPRPADLFVYFRGGVLAKSTNGGRSWSQLPAPAFKGGAAVDFVTARYGWIQDGGLIYATGNGGKRWLRMKSRHP